MLGKDTVECVVHVNAFGHPSPSPATFPSKAKVRKDRFNNFGTYRHCACAAPIWGVMSDPPGSASDFVGAGGARDVDMGGDSQGGRAARGGTVASQERAQGGSAARGHNVAWSLLASLMNQAKVATATGVVPSGVRWTNPSMSHNKRTTCQT